MTEYLYRCDNCGETHDLDAMNPIKRVFERVAPGEPVPAGECPSCGCLCHRKAVTRRHAKSESQGR